MTSAADREKHHLAVGRVDLLYEADRPQRTASSDNRPERPAGGSSTVEVPSGALTVTSRPTAAVTCCGACRP
jgi:hypothetical protein